MTAIGHEAAVDVQVFADQVLGRPLWDHQLDVLTCPARYRVIAAGRQVGKSVLLATAALYEAATRRGVTVLLVSAGEVASRRLLAECAALASGSALLSGVLDESRSELALSNGSRILSVPASERQIRGWPVDLLIVDEAGFIADHVWRAAEPAIIARPGSRVILASSPWGGPEAFFRSLWQRGMDRPDEQVRSWHWPSTVSPMVDAALLEEIRQREPADYFAREFLAEWADAAGAYFAESEIMDAVADYELTAPEDLPLMPPGEPGFPVAAGVDWGMARDANALVLLGAASHRSDGVRRLFVPHLEASSSVAYTRFIDRVVEVAGRYQVTVIASERNGVGEFPTQELRERLYARGRHSRVSPVWTDARRKMSGFGMLKGLMAQGRIVLPNHPDLLRELRALEFEQTESGLMRIAVPERAGHDDLAMALMQAVSCVSTFLLGNPADSDWSAGPIPDPVLTGAGVPFPRHPFPDRDLAPFHSPSGRDRTDGW